MGMQVERPSSRCDLLACISERVFRTGDLKLKFETTKLHDIIKGSERRLESIVMPGQCSERSNMKKQGNQEELTKVRENPGTCDELEAK